MYILIYKVNIYISFSRYLTDQKEINLNVRDKWDSTPLYYACLCGHPEVVSFLLENGARCEANTFDGERCVYGALTDQIRKMLNNFSVISSRVRRYVVHKCIRVAFFYFCKKKYALKKQNHRLRTFQVFIWLSKISNLFAGANLFMNFWEDYWRRVKTLT